MVKPVGSFYEDINELQSIVRNFVSRMLQDKLKYEDIVILTTTSVKNSMLHVDMDINGVPLSIEPKKNHVLFTSVRKFKGLEAKAVLLIDVFVNKLDDELHKRLVYVGASRANTYLQLAFYDSVHDEAYSRVIQALTGENNPNSDKNELLEVFGLDPL